MEKQTAVEKQTVMTLQCFSASLCLCLAKLQPPLILWTQLPFLKTGASVLFLSFGRAEVMQVKNICSGNLGKSCKFLIKFRATGNNLQLLSIQVFMQQALAKRSSVGLMNFTKLYVIVNPYSRKMYTVSDQDIQNVVVMNCFFIAKSSSGRRLPFGWGRVQDVSSSALHSSLVCMQFGHIILSCILRILNMIIARIHHKHNLKCIYRYQQLCCTIWIIPKINKDNSELAFNAYEFGVRLNENKIDACLWIYTALCGFVKSSWRS